MTTQLSLDTSGLSEVERSALDVTIGVYERVRHADIMDSKLHWERFASRLESSAYAPDGPRFLQQLARKFGVRDLYHEATAGLLQMPRDQQAQVLRTIRRESVALSALTREARR